MARIWTDILLPAAIAGAVAAQTLGVEIHRASRLHAWFPRAARDTVQVDTVKIRPDSLKNKQDSLKARLDSLAQVPDSLAQIPDSLLQVPDSLLRSPLDSLAEEEDFDLFYTSEEQDTVPSITARDTMKVPDSLRLTDPFLYQWYVATKDSYIHKLVVDSLKAEGDSLIWPRVDSLYLADSTYKAKLAWEKKWAGMSKAERKRWTYENVQLPAILHKQDSIRKIKDSLQHIKDSIRDNTPRILETSFIPDSLYFKRYITWRNNRLYNRVETFEWDTTANYHFQDYPFMRGEVGASWLGMPGSAVLPHNFLSRDKENSPSFYQAMESWTYTPDNMVMWNTKTPYTELEYSGNLLESSTLSTDNFRVFTTQNIFPSVNIALEMKRYGGAGTLKNEHTDNRSYFAVGNYLGKRYLAQGGFIYNKVSRQESGGGQETMWIRDTTVDVREIDVNLAAATNSYRKRSLFFDQSYRIPFSFIEKLRHRGDSTWVRPDTLVTDITTAFIGTSSELSTFSKNYVDNTSGNLPTFYNGVFNINPSKSVDSLRNMRLDNRIFLRLQPWKEDAIVSKVEGGVGNRYQQFYLATPSDVLYKPSNITWNTLYTYAGAEGRLGKYLAWDATGLYNFAGAQANDFFLKANATLNIYPFRRQPKSPISLKASFQTRLDTPDFYQQHFYTNHYRWENDFTKISTTQVDARLEIPRWRLKAQVGYSLLAGHVYYDTLGIARQHTGALSVFTAALTKDLVFGPIHLDNTALLQLSSQPDVLPLPTLALNLRWYVQLNVVDPKVLQLQLGVNGRYNTLWYAPSYNPVSGTFMLQRSEEYGNCPVFDVFINAQWKKCCVFIKLENAGNGWPKDNHDYFSAHRYIQTPRALKFGISWPFYPRLGQQKTLSERAGSGMGSGPAGGDRNFGAGAGGNSSLGGGNRSTSRL